jgi:hypothetical protein
MAINLWKLLFGGTRDYQKLSSFEMEFFVGEKSSFYPRNYAVWRSYLPIAGVTLRDELRTSGELLAK